MTGAVTIRDYVVRAISAAASTVRPSPRIVCALPVYMTVFALPTGSMTPRGVSSSDRTGCARQN